MSGSDRRVRTPRGEGDPGAATKRELPESLKEIVPAGILFLDKAELPSAVPSLDLLFARDRGIDVFVRLVPDKDMDAIFLGEPFDQVAFVFPDASADIVRHAGVQRSVSSARKNIDVVKLLHLGPLPSRFALAGDDIII